MIAAPDLARRLLARDLTPDRYRKLAQHVASPKHFEAILAAIPEEQRAEVRAGVLPHLPSTWTRGG